MATISHPYYPLGSEMAGYVANELQVGPIFGIFGAGVLAVMVATRLMTKPLNPNLNGRDQALVIWFVLCKSSCLTSFTGVDVYPPCQ